MRRAGYAKEYYKKNSSRCIANVRKYQRTHSKEILEQRRKWRIKNRDKLRREAKLWKLKNRERYLACERKTYYKYKDSPEFKKKRNAYLKGYHEKNRERILAAAKKDYPRRKARDKQLRADKKEQILQHYGKRCNCCGFEDGRFLTIDHVNNGHHNKMTKKERKINTLIMYRKIIAEGYPKSYQILCMNCNWAKGVFDVCPHQTDKELGFD